MCQTRPKAVLLFYSQQQRKVMEKQILSKEAKSFLNHLSKNFNNKIEDVLEERKGRTDLPNFEAPTDNLRNADWKIDAVPEEIFDRRVEITGPPVRKMIINALNSGANIYMSDFEDSNCPTWENCIQGQVNLRDAINGTIDYTNPNTGKSYKLNDQIATLFVRPRGLHLVEKNYVVNGSPIRASLFDFGLYLFHNYKALLKKGSRPYFYLPKLEHHKEARLWAKIFSYSEGYFGIPVGTIKATVLIETLPAAFQMDEILYELRHYSAGLNCGRWDYIFSFIKTTKNFREFVLPDRDSVGMTEHFMRCYSQLLVQTCHKRGAHAIGGMAAQIPIKNDSEENHKAMAKVRADKLREVQDGHDGTWVAHPALVGLAKDVFDAHMTSPNQINKQLCLNSSITQKDLLCSPKGACTEKGLRKNIKICFQYLNAWINGNGCVPIDNLMEDAATAEISRAQIWQWLKYNVWLDDGKQVTEDYFIDVVDDELKTMMNLNQFNQTKKVFLDLCTSKEIIDFLTLPCYDLIP